MASSKEHVLVVESDPDISDLIARQTLVPLGYRVTVAPEGAAAIQQALQLAPDLIIANLNLPGLSGKDLLVAFSSRAIRAPLIVIAEKGQESDVIQAFRLGAGDVLFWPARDTEVAAVAERALKQTREARARQRLDQRLNETNEELQRKVQQLTTILATGKAVVSITNQRQLFDRILEAALQVAEAEIGWLMLRDEHSKTFLLAAYRNLPDGWSKKLNQPLDDGISSLVTLSGESLVVHGQPLQKFKVAALGQSAGVIPIKVKGEVIGLLIVVRKADAEIGREAQTLLEAVADFASTSLVNARLFRALEQTADAAHDGERQQNALFERIRSAATKEIQAASGPLHQVMSGNLGNLNEAQKEALESVEASLKRLSQATEKTVPAEPITLKK
ncbi:MAG: response regulator [Bacteroidota bacterium]